MSKVFVVSDDDIRIIFVSSYYDHPLSGVCIYDGKVCQFDREYCEDAITVRVLSIPERFKKWVRRTMFGICVGWHWHYGLNGKRARFFGGRHPKWFWGALANAYYRRPLFRGTFFSWKW